MLQINFDMDGTIADLYGYEGWLDCLMAEDTAPYDKATPLINMSSLARVLNRLQRNGYQIGIISWLSKNGSETYQEAVTKAKLKWIAKHLPSVVWDNISIVPYGTPKSTLGSGILFDDEEQNRIEWNGKAYDVDDIINILKAL